MKTGKNRRGENGEKSPRTLSRLIRRICRVLSLIIGAALFLGLVIALLATYCNAPPASPPPKAVQNNSLYIDEEGYVFIEVRNGESAMSVGRRLEEAGLIKTRYFWNILSRLYPEFIKTGMYRVNYPASQTEIRSVLVSGKQILTKLTIPEGVTLGKIARFLADAGICDAEAFRAAASDPEIRRVYHVPGPTMEGYLYPDTYLFPVSCDPVVVVRTMADTFFQRLIETREEALSMTPGELNERVILASIVEREYRRPEEAPLMAGVFYNRLNIGMALQSCATVEYIITEIQGKPHPSTLYERDTEIENPYNTYIRPGLPPGPISAPGKVALDAVFNPKASDYLYFRLVDPVEGRHYFSKTFDDHIRAASLYVKGSAVD
ncbi:MAG: endolytic transglycosylase MltG [Spirochaetaceae bacterium]|jgi:UPF0755 protein|nr:endolytic transglycosylase MltG [Spirochaetaceae bacterium]